ncbi:MAG TPA: serine/threonine-protein kinase [Kofleriaceae bacterium]|nr:serine/threonine-protein kinase [Kofleriaceae bacterium]
MTAPGGIPFGHFTLGKRLARGGMAEVFLARQRGPEGFDRRVAVKRILPHLADSTDFVGMFLDEARLAARLTHPNIVHIYELGSVDGSFFIAMEYVDGVTAAQLIRHAADEALPPALVARIGADAAGALAYAHRLEDGDGRPVQLVHRDVSPANVMVSFDGVVKLVDFGIAKAANKAEETRPGIVKGKYAYMSPEQTTGKPLDGRSDVFSLGVVLWELLAGRTIVERGDVVEAMKVIRDGRFPRIEQVAPEVPEALAIAVGWALEVKRDDRPTAQQLQISLEEFIKGSPQLATPAQLAEWIQPRFPRLSSTRELPAFDGARPARRTVPPNPGASFDSALAERALRSGRPGDVPLGTQVAAITGEAAPAPARMVSTRPSAVPPPLPRPPTIEDLPDLDVLLGDDGNTTRVLDPRRTSRPRGAPIGRHSRVLVIALTAASVAAAIALVGWATTDRDPVIAAPAAIDAGAPAPAPASVELADAAPLAVVELVDAAAAPPAIEDTARVPAPATATLEVITRPARARVQVGGGPRRTSPVAIRELAPDRYTVTVEKPGYQPLARTIDLGAGEHRTLELTLEKASRPAARIGYLTARTEPYSVVYLGARRLGETPFAAVALPAGTHTLTFKHPGRRPVTRRVTIRAGETAKLNFKL